MRLCCGLVVKCVPRRRPLTTDLSLAQYGGVNFEFQQQFMMRRSTNVHFFWRLEHFSERKHQQTIAAGDDGYLPFVVVDEAPAVTGKPFIGRMLLAIVSDQEWFVVDHGERIRLEHTAAADEVRPLLLSAGRPTGVLGPMENFDPALTREQWQAWLEEGALHAEIELEWWANVCLPVIAPVSSVLLLLNMDVG